MNRLSQVGTSITSPCIIELPRIGDRRGNLTFVQSPDHVPFEIKRLYFLYEVPAGESRGGHAHRELQQLLIAVSGSFDVIVDNGRKREIFHLFKPYSALYLPKLHWRDLINFSSGSVCLVAASHIYDEADYIRDHSEFLRLVIGPNET